MAGTKKAKASLKTKSRKSASRTASKKKTAKKKTIRAGASRKKAVKKKSAARKPASRSLRTEYTKKTPVVEPGPPPGMVPPVEEPMLQEHAVGVVTHYYSHLGVAVVQVNTGVLRTGDTIRIKGHTTDITQAVGSMEYEHHHVEQAEAGQSVGIKVFDHVREHDIVYVIQ